MTQGDGSVHAPQILRAFGPQDDSSPLLIWEKRRKEKDVQWARGLTAPLWALARA